MTNQRLVPLTLGWQELDRCVALDGYPPGESDRILLAGRGQALASIDGFKEAAGAVGALMVPGHDPDVWGLIPRWFGSSLGSHVGSHRGALR